MNASLDNQAPGDSVFDQNMHICLITGAIIVMHPSSKYSVKPIFALCSGYNTFNKLIFVTIQ